MKILKAEQRSEEWFKFRAGKIGGTRVAQVLSNRKNKLLYDLLDERLSGVFHMGDFINEDMEYGIANESVALDLYSKRSKIRFHHVGAIISDYSSIHHASPDGLNRRRGIVAEVKCTMHGAVHIQRYFDGVSTEHMPQLLNYFAVSDAIKEVHYISYCGFRTERPLIWHVLRRDAFENEVVTIRSKIAEIENRLNDMEKEFRF